MALDTEWQMRISMKQTFLAGFSLQDDWMKGTAEYVCYCVHFSFLPHPLLPLLHGIHG